MKTIQVTDDMHEKLIALATEMTTQDNRITAMPFMFQVKEEQRVYDYGLNGSNRCLMYEGEQEHDFESEDDLREIITDNCSSGDRDVPDFENMDFDDMVEWMEARGYEQVTWSVRHVYKNTFFTAKACQEHIDANRHHYNNPTVFLNRAFRNPEMELVSELLCHIVGKKPIK